MKLLVTLIFSFLFATSAFAKSENLELSFSKYISREGRVHNDDILMIIDQLRPIENNGRYEGKDPNGKKCYLGIISYEDTLNTYDIYFASESGNVNTRTNFQSPQSAEGGALFVPFYSFVPEQGDMPGSVELSIVNIGGFSGLRLLAFKMLVLGGKPISLKIADGYESNHFPDGKIIPVKQYETCSSLRRVGDLY